MWPRSRELARETGHHAQCVGGGQAPQPGPPRAPPAWERKQSLFLEKEKKFGISSKNTFSFQSPCLGRCVQRCIIFCQIHANKKIIRGLWPLQKAVLAALDSRKCTF